MSEQLACPKCLGAMQEGFILEFTSHASSSASRWVEGVPAKALLFGLRTADKEQHPIQSYRCQACGYLESYARGE
jgi:Domain of unknown function (DUF6487)